MSSWWKHVLTDVLLVIMIFLASCTRSPRDAEVRELFQEHRSEFIDLRDMILTESVIFSIGNDNVGDFWLSNDKWTNHNPPYIFYTEAEMLSLVDLSEERYHRYLELLDSVGGYRVTKNISNEQVAIYLFRRGIVSSGETVNIVYLLKPPSYLTNDTENANGNSKIYYSNLEEYWYIEREK